MYFSRSFTCRATTYKAAWCIHAHAPIKARIAVALIDIVVAGLARPALRTLTSKRSAQTIHALTAVRAFVLRCVANRHVDFAV